MAGRMLTPEIIAVALAASLGAAAIIVLARRG
jgi:hypothetical protein